MGAPLIGRLQYVTEYVQEQLMNHVIYGILFEHNFIFYGKFTRNMFCSATLSFGSSMR